MNILFEGNILLEVHPTDEAYRYRAIRTLTTLTLYFSLPEHVEVPVGAYVEYEGQTFTLNDEDNFKKNGARNFEYTLLLDAEDANLKKYKAKDQSGRLKFSMTAKPHEHLQMIVNNLNQRESGWTIGLYVDATEKVIAYNHMYLIEALNAIADEFNTEWEINGKEISLRRVEYNKSAPLALSYGKGNGFKPGVGRTTEKKGVEVLYVQGGSRNIDASKYGSTDLLLPKSQSYTYEGRVYITDSDGLYIKRGDKALTHGNEDSLDLTNIYPSRVGATSGVNVVDASKNFYDIIDSSIPGALDYEACLIDGEKMTIIFQTGMLTSREFEVKYIHADRRFEIVPAEIDGQTMPGGVFLPAIGDKYAVFGIQLPAAYVSDNSTQTGSSWDMFKEAVKYLYENEETKFTFTGEMDGIWAKQNWLAIGAKIKPGGYVDFSDPQFAPDGVLIRIMGVKDYINRPQSPVLELSNSTSGSTLSSELKKIGSNEVVAENLYKSLMRYTKRRFRDSQETLKMLEDAMLAGFGDAISPITIKTMALLIGDESLQFRFVDDMTTPVEVPNNIVYNSVNKVLMCPAGIIQHMTLGITKISPQHSNSEYKFWSLPPYATPPLTTADKSYYLYAKVSKTDTTGQYVMSETAIDMEAVSGYYHFLIGILNSEYSGDRSFVTLYGFTEILPGRITTDRIVSSDGQTYFDLANGIIGGQLRFVSGGIEKSVATEINNTNNKIDNLKIANENLLIDSSFEGDRSFLTFTTGGNNIYNFEKSSDYAFNGNYSIKATVLRVSPTGVTRFFLNISPSNNGGPAINYTYGVLNKLKGSDGVYCIRVKAVGSAIGKQVFIVRNSNSGDASTGLFTLTGEWQMISTTFNVPQNTTYLNFYFSSLNTLAAGDVLYFDCDFFGIGNKVPEGWTASNADIIAQTAKLITLSGATQIITVSKTGVNTPASPFTVTGSAQNTTITIWEYSIDGGSYSSTLPTGVARSGDVVTIDPATVTFKGLNIKASDGTYNDTFTVARAIDGQDGGTGPTGAAGAAGQDAYTLLLTNESHTFSGSETAAVAGSTTSQVIMYKGANPITPTSITIGAMPTGMTASVSGTTITWNVTTALVNASGTVQITVIVDGKTFPLTFSYAVSFKGTNGVSITGADVEFAVNTNPTTAPTTGWTTTAPTLTAGQQLWTRTKTTYSSGSPTYSSPANITPKAGADGAAGRSIVSVEEEYYLSTSKVTPTGGSWSTMQPTWENGKYLCTRVKITYSNPTSIEYTTPVIDSSWEAVNDIKTSGVNLIDDSSFENGRGLTPYGSYFTASISTDYAFKGSKSAKLTLGATDASVSYGSYLVYNLIPGNDLKGKQVNYSIWIKATGSAIGRIAHLEFYCYTEDSTATGMGGDTTLTGEWQQLNYTFIVPSDATNLFTYIFGIFQLGDVIYLDCDFLGLGNKPPADWSPSLKDVQASIDAAAATASSAFAAASTAQSTADGKIQSFYQTSAPSSASEGDIWFDTDDGNKVYTYRSGVWVNTQDSQIAAAINSAQTAQTTADGKADVYYQTAAPTGLATSDKGDIWIDTDDNNKMYVWSGTVWQVAQDYYTALSIANSAQSAANAASDAVADMLNDNILDPKDKQSLKEKYDAIKDEYLAMTSQANSLGVSTTSYLSAYNTLIGYIDSNNLLSNLTTNSPVDGATLRSYIKNYAYQREWLSSSITSALRTSANNANNTANDALNQVNDLKQGTSNILTGSRAERSVSNASTTIENYIAWQPPVTFQASTRYAIGFYYKTTDNCKGVDCYFINTSDGSRSRAFALNQAKTFGEYKYFEGTILTSADAGQTGYIRFTNRGSEDGLAATLYIKAVMLVKGSAPGDWKPHSTESFNTYSGIPSNYVAGDKWVPTDNYTFNGVVFQAGKEYIANQSSSTMNGAHWQATGRDSAYLTEVFKETVVVGKGVLLAGVIGATENGVVKSYINGITSKEIAAAYGVTGFGLPTETQMGIDRFDGSGFRAGGNLVWGAGGNVSIIGTITAISGTFNNVNIVSGVIGGWDIQNGGLSNQGTKVLNEISSYSNIKSNGEFMFKAFDQHPSLPNQLGDKGGIAFGTNAAIFGLWSGLGFTMNRYGRAGFGGGAGYTLTLAHHTMQADGSTSISGSGDYALRVIGGIKLDYLPNTTSGYDGGIVKIYSSGGVRYLVLA